MRTIGGHDAGGECSGIFIIKGILFHLNGLRQLPCNHVFRGLIYLYCCVPAWGRVASKITVTPGPLYIKDEADLLCQNRTYVTTKSRGVRVSLPFYIVACHLQRSSEVTVTHGGLWISVPVGFYTLVLGPLTSSDLDHRAT